MPWWGPFGVHLVWDFLCFLDFHVYFLHQIREVFFHYFFQIDFQFLALSLLLLAPLWCKYWNAWSCPRGCLYYPHFLDSIFFLLFWLVVFCFLIFQIIDLILSFITLLLFPCKLFFILISVAFISDWTCFMLLRS